MPPLIFCLMLLFALAATGCSSSPPSIEAPAFDAASAAKQAIADYDANGNGTIEGAELNKSPALKDALAQIDKDGKQITLEALTARMQSWRQISVIPIVCTVVLDGAPVEGATVTFVPEKFLGAARPQATGKTDSNGAAIIVSNSPELAAKRITGVYSGLYSVSITGGQPEVPADYGAKTPLGLEVAADAKRGGEPIRFELTSQ